MSQPSSQQSQLENYSSDMKRDWDARAREDAKWYINTVRRGQSEEEFDATCRHDIENFILADLPVLTGGRDPRTLRLLEIGCGIGRMTRHLARLFGEVHGTDVSGEMIRLGRERLRDCPNVFLHETSGCDFAAFPDAHFDLIFSAYVFQHIPSAEVIRANIRDAYRVLKPGGIFKFMAAGISSEEYAQMPKDTWTGAPFAEADSRQIARELGAQLMSVVGEGTQYFWTVLRKRTQSELTTTGAQPQIIVAGRADDLTISEVPSRGDKAWLGLKVAGLELAEADCSDIAVELRGRDLLPVYAGPAGISPDASALSGLLQINVRIPADDPGGTANVRVKLKDGRVSEAVTAAILPPEPVPPKITLVSNAFDGGTDLQARGPKSLLRVFVDNLDRSASVETVIVRIGERDFTPQSLTFQPNNAVFLLTVQLPEDMQPQATEIRVNSGGLQSAPWPVLIS
ncbi:MAG TPA: methyltransferase domain-containing protein [Blastocatellia bacterium]|nr:methyltransferase domain-containing protein [Blastocatellia bacterium]